MEISREMGGLTYCAQEDLPKNAQAYVKLIEDYCGVPIAWIGTGPGREDMITRSV